MNVMNVANRIRKVSQELMTTTDPERRADLEVELADLEEELEELEAQTFKDWS